MRGEHILLQTILLFVVASFPPLVIFSAKYRKQNKKARFVYMPGVFQVFGIIFWLGEIGLSIGFLFLRYRLLAVLALAVGILACLLFVVAYGTFIQYDKNSFWVYRLFRQPVQYRYSDITGYKFEIGTQYVLYTRSGRVYIDKLALGSGEFLFYARDRALELTGDIVPSRQLSLFHGYVLNPGGMVAVMVIVGILMVGVSVWGTFGFKETVPDDLLTIEAPICGVRSDWADIILQTSEGSIRTSRMHLSNDDMISLQDKIDMGNTFRLTITPWTVSTKQESAVLWGLQDKEYIYFTPSDVLTHRVQNSNQAKLVLWVFTVCHWLFFGFFCYVLSNAPKYPRIAALLVRKEYRNF